jgi:type IV pilus assembly protein PilO
VSFFWKKQQVLICIVAVMLVVDFVWFGCLPLQKTMRAIKQTKTSLGLAIDKGTTGGRQLPVLTEQLQKLQQATSNFEVNVPLRRDLGVFLQQLADLTARHNLKEQIVVPQKEIKTEDLGCIPINMQCKGRLTQIFEFYKQLQKLDRLVRIEQVKLVNDSSFEGEVSTETKLVIYYWPTVDSIGNSRLPNTQEVGEVSNGIEHNKRYLEESQKT